MAASKDQIVLAIEIAGRAAASKEVKELRSDVRGLGPDTQKSGKQADSALGQVERQVRKTGDQADTSFTKMRRGAKRSGDEIEQAAPKFRKAASPIGTLAKRAAAAGAAFLSIKYANESVDTLEELGTAAMGLSGNFGMSEKQAGRWAALAKVRNLAPKALNQSFGTLAKNVSAVAPAVDKQRAAMSKLSRTQQQKLAAAENITNAQKREATIAKILATGDVKRSDLSSKSLGKQAEALKKFGLSSEDAASANTDMYGFLMKVADGYEKLGPGTNRSALAMSLFGKGWQTLRPLLSKGSEGLKEQLNLVDEYGANVAGSTDSLAEHAKKQREQKIAMLGIQVQLGTVLLPLYAKAADLTVDMAKKANKAWPEVKKQITPVVNTTEKVVDVVTKFVGKHPELIKVAAGFVAVTTAAKGLKLAGNVTGINKVLKLLWKMRTSAKLANEAGAAAGETYASSAGRSAGKNIGPEMNKRKGRFSKAGGAMGKVMGIAAGAALAAYAVKLALDNVNKNVDDTIEAAGAEDKDPTVGKYRRKGKREKQRVGGDAGSESAFDAWARDHPALAAKWKRADPKEIGERGTAKYRRYEKELKDSDYPGDFNSKYYKANRKKRATGGVVGRGETTQMNEHGPELAVLPSGTQVLTAGHPWSRAAAESARAQASSGPTGGSRRGYEQRPTIRVPVFIGQRLIYEAVSEETERQALKK
ncbi:hypothetical protein [Patulibacter minatonensis]|uniref:hypothetical protein n=1 Tax=Patulibacter minatonensis TaxID=298163 RepID=UPI0004B4E16F|nr:hypothetical protein [Patulibacter minatonensis]